MAISKNIDTQFGITVEGCYLRVEHPSLTKDTLSFHLRKYVAIDKPFFAEDIISCGYDILGANPFEQAYTYLKTLPEYADAVDC